MNELAYWAHRYADARIPVFPLRPRGKEPRIPRAHPQGHPCRGECGAWGHGLYDATTDHAQIGRWWGRWPNPNIGIPCGPASGWLVVDLDGLAAWAKLEAEHGQAPTLVSITGRGRHLVYAWPAGCELGNSSDRLGPHIDTRGIGGYICAPPSTHPTGRPYRWCQDTPGAPNAPQEPPTWLLDRLRDPAPAPRRERRQGSACVVGAVPSDLPRHLERQAAEAPGSDRSRQTYRLIAAAIEWGLPDDQILGLALSHKPTVEKYGDGDRARDQVDVIIGRVRPDHRHVGRPCDIANCPRAPRWMVTA